MPVYADSQAFFSAQNSQTIRMPPPESLAVGCVTFAPPFLLATNETLKAVRSTKRAVLKQPGVRLVQSARDVFASQTAVGVVPMLQHTPHDVTFDRMKALSAVGIRFMSIAYEGPTPFGDGYKGEGGLTRAGEQLLEWMADPDVRITPDLSHASAETARDILNYIWKQGLPLTPCATHTGCRDVFPLRRNMPNDVLRGIADMGGYVGILALSCLITEEGADPFRAIANHVSHAITICGPDAVGIGSDCQHFDMTMQEARALHEWLLTKVKPDGVYFPDRDERLVTNGGNMFDILRGRALMRFDSDTSTKVLGQNLLQYLRRVL